MKSSKASLKKLTAIATAVPLFALFGCELNATATEATTEPSGQTATTSPQDDEMKVVRTQEDLPNCTQKREGEMALVSKNESVYVCTNGRWNKGEVVLSSSSIDNSEESSSSEEPIVDPYSSSDTPIVFPPEQKGCFETWNGSEGSYRINTGFDNGTETSGYWYVFADDADGGMSTIIWPVSPGNSYTDDAFDPIIDACGGICGTYDLNKGSLTYDPYTGVGFNLAGLSSNDITVETVDASSMGGIEVTYTSEAVMMIEMGLGDKNEASINYDVPSYTLPKATTPTTRRIPWSKFKQAGWGKIFISGETAAKTLANIRFKIQGKNGLTGKFNIMSVGSYYQDACYQPPVIRSSSSNIWPESSDSHINPTNVAKCENFETWHGSDGAYKIDTGCDRDNENGGYWFEYDDSSDGGLSKITWPVEKGNVYSDEAMDPIIDYCGGLCGSYELNQGTLSYQPYIGVGFEYAGHDYSGELQLADASAQNGVCITYTSDAAAVLEMSLGDAKDAALGYDVPFVSLPKSSVGTTKHFTWSKFKQAGWGIGKISGEEAAKSIASLRFKIQAKNGTSGSFNITSIGPYNGDCGVSYVLN